MRDYEKEFHEKAFADPYIQYKWYDTLFKREQRWTNRAIRHLGKDLTVEQYEQAIKERGTFRDWMRTAILPQPSDGQSLDKMLIFPSGDIEPFYRHEYIE